MTAQRVSTKIPTGDWRRTVANRYLQATLYRADEIFARGQGTEGGREEPLKWKLYQGVTRIQLSDHPLDMLGDIRRVLSGEQPATPIDRFDEDLSTLLYLSYGFSRWEPSPGPGWPMHRTVASARCFYPTELYVALPEQPHIGAGVYHYDPAHHAVSLLRKGNVIGQLGEAAGANLANARCVLLVSSLFWKNAFKYRDYAYRLCTQEAGMVVGNVLAVAAGFGYDQHVHYQFLDRAVNCLLGLDAGQESVLAVVAVYPRDARPGGIRRADVAVDETRLLATISAISPRYRDLGRLSDELCGMVTEIDESSFLGHTKQFSCQQPAAHRCERGDVLPIERDVSHHFDLVDALRTRNSGRVLFAPVGDPVAASTLLDIARYSSDGYTSDLRPSGTSLLLTVRLVVNHVDQVPVGVYEYCHAHQGLHTIASGDPVPELQAVLKVPNVDLRAANMVAYILGDHGDAIRTFGNRAYRILNVEAGVLAQRISLLSAAHGLTARVHNGYDATLVKELLQLPAANVTPLFQIIIGRGRFGVRYGLPVKL